MGGETLVCIVCLCLLSRGGPFSFLSCRRPHFSRRVRTKPGKVDSTHQHLLAVIFKTATLPE